MRAGKTPISKAVSYDQIGDFWDTRDLADHWDETKHVDVEVDIRSRTTYFAVERDLSARIRKLAEERGVSAETLLNLWMNEKLSIEAMK